MRYILLYIIVKGGIYMLKRIFLLLCIFLLIFSVGCSSFTANNSSDVISNNQKTETLNSIEDNEDDSSSNENNGIDSSNPNDELENDVKLPMGNNYNTTEEEAVRIAFEEAKKYEDEYNLIIDDNTISDYTCEIKQKDGVVFYDIIFKNISLKNHADDIKTQIGIWVNVDSGAVIDVVQYK